MRESEARWRAMVQHAGDVIFRVGPDGRLIDLNAPSFERLTGLSRAAWIGQPAGRLAAPGDRAAVAEALARALEGDDCVRVSARIRTAEGSWRVAEFVLTRFDTESRQGPALETAVAPDVPPLLTDREKLRLVLRNLVGNALKFTERGTVRVAVAPAQDGVEIRVEDTGPGIPPEERDLIFEAFRQGTAARPRGGVGLGLHLVRRVLDVLGGSVRVESEVGRGSTFRVWLPVDGVRQAARDVAAASTAR